MDTVVDGLISGGTGALILLIAIILYGGYKIIKDIMDKNDKREIRLNNTIADNQKVINKAMNVIAKDVDVLKEDMKVTKEDIKVIKERVI